jgi:hypothetical protein
VNFNTDSGPMGVDNRCSTCMSSQREDFEDNLVAVNGMVHRHRIPGSHFAPGLEARLFSPQHFAQSKGDTHPLQGEQRSPLTRTVWSCNGTNGSTE